MADIALVTANTARIVGIPVEQMTKPGAEAVTALQAVRQDASTGKWTKANGTTAAEANVYGLATRTPEATGLGITVIRKGVVDGFDLSALDYGAALYLSDTDGAIADTPGTVPVKIGYVSSAFAAGVGNSADKVLVIDVQNLAAELTYAGLAAFVSAETTATGSAQNVAHGLGVAPSKVLVSFTELPADLAAGADIAEGTHTTTNVVLTVAPSGAKFKVLAFA